VHTSYSFIVRLARDAGVSGNKLEPLLRRAHKPAMLIGNLAQWAFREVQDRLFTLRRLGY
jgi:hypothetical protein